MRARRVIRKAVFGYALLNPCARARCPSTQARFPTTSKPVQPTSSGQLEYSKQTVLGH